MNDPFAKRRRVDGDDGGAVAVAGGGRDSVTSVVGDGDGGAVAGGTNTVSSPSAAPAAATAAAPAADVGVYQRHSRRERAVTQMTIPEDKAPARRGKWTPEEEEYTNAVSWCRQWTPWGTVDEVSTGCVRRRCCRFFHRW